MRVPCHKSWILAISLARENLMFFRCSRCLARCSAKLGRLESLKSVCRIEGGRFFNTALRFGRYWELQCITITQCVSYTYREYVHRTIFCHENHLLALSNVLRIGKMAAWALCERLGEYSSLEESPFSWP